MSNSLNNILSNQQQVQEIVNAENARIDSKQQTYDNMEFGKQRIVQLNRNLQQRTTAFNWIIAIICITLAFVIFLLFLNKIIPEINDYTNSAIMIILFVGSAYCIYLYLAFIQRNPANYDEILYLSSQEEKDDSNRTTTARPRCSSKKNGNTVSTTPPLSGCGNNISTTPVTPSVTFNTNYGNATIIAPGNVVSANIPPSTTLSSTTLSSTTLPSTTVVTTGNMVTTGNVTPSTSEMTNDYNNYILHLISIFSPENSPSNNVSSVNKCSSKTSLDSGPYIPTGNIPKLITNEIFLGPYGRLTILVIHTKKFLFYNLNISVDEFISYDGIHFRNKENPTLTAKVVTRGPMGPMGQNINGKGIMMSVAGFNYYFYLSKFPALLLDGDIFIGPNGQTTIQVMSQNEFILVNPGGNNSSNNTANVLRTYHSTDGSNFIDTQNSENTGLVVVTGPQSPLLQNIYGQAIRLKNKTSGEDVYFYYNGNTVSDIINEISTATLETTSVPEPSTDMPSPPSTDMPSPPNTDMPSPPNTDMPSPPNTDMPSPPNTDMPSPPNTDMPSPPSTDTTGVDIQIADIPTRNVVSDTTDISSQNSNPNQTTMSTVTFSPAVTSLPVSTYESTTMTPTGIPTVTYSPNNIVFQCGKEPEVLLIRQYLNSIAAKLPHNNSNPFSESLILRLIDENVKNINKTNLHRLYSVKAFSIFLKALHDKANKNQSRQAMLEFIKRNYPNIYSNVQNVNYNIASQSISCYLEQQS